MQSNLAVPMTYEPPRPTHANWLTDDEVERFWRDVDKRDNGCWYFNGAAGGRSGLFIWRAGNMASHRVAYRLMTGRILKGTEFLKPECRDQRCINPEHNAVVPRHLLQAVRQQHTANALEAHRAYAGLMSDRDLIEFLSQPGAMAWTTKTGRHYVWWHDAQHEGESLEEAVRAARDAA